MKTPSLISRRLKPFGWAIPGAAMLALWMFTAVPMLAVTMEPEPTPAASEANDNLPAAATSSHDEQAIKLQLRLSDARESRFGLTSGQLAVDKSATLSEAPSNLLLSKRDRGASAESLVHVDSRHTVAIEDLAAVEKMNLPAQIIILAAGGMALFFFSLALSYRQLQRPRGKRVRFGILWSAFKPICGKCGSDLSVLNDYSFQCPTCGVELGARGENGNTISPREALSKIRLKEYW